MVLVTCNRMLLMLGMGFAFWSSVLVENLCAKQDFALSGHALAKSVSINIRLKEAGRLTNSVEPCGTKIVYVEGYGPAGELAQWLASRTEIEELNLICICFVESDIQAILSLPKLTHLNFRGCRLTFDQLNKLKAHRSRPTIELTGVVLLSE
ncbi:hypothetical protein KOR42_44500 [Thalassoglobus neptunius]|uniref:Leucine Rich repeats (2 copies) n=1 Tax=Thalassoglobus neptunius TaxID=1938619 RepID=A0A5C5VYQ2_9PLAN|nr:hypothetical protein [Thalassoglobus neptunius]TWT43570.1 hypothetical protein KOR42_44500 [Thalassoglobus neptunius]